MQFKVSKDGFSVIELLIVIAVIGILAAIAIPAYIGVQARAARSEAKSNLETLRLLEEQRFAEQGSYVPSSGTISGLTAIQAELPGFQPGLDSDLKYSYSITINQDYQGNAKTTCFRARAQGKSGTNVAGDDFSIDCDNNKNF